MQKKKGTGTGGNIDIHTKDTNKARHENRDFAKEIFKWIASLALVLVVMWIAKIILDQVLPENWWNKYKYIIYPVGLLISGWIDKKM